MLTADELRAIRERLNRRRVLRGRAGEFPTLETSEGRLAWELIDEGINADVDVDTLLAEVERKGMRLFEITGENIKLRAEVERLQEQARLCTCGSILPDDVIVRSRQAGIDLAAKIRRFNGGR